MSIDSFFKRTIYYTLHLLLILTPLIWAPKMSELFEFPKMLFVYALTSIVAISWIIRMVIHKKILIHKTYLDLPIILFLASQIISTLASIDIHTSLFGYYSRFHGGLFSTISYITLYYAWVSNIDKDQTKRLLKSILFGAILASLYAFPEHFGASPSCAIIGSGWIADCWVQDVVLRVFGTFGQPNWLAAYLITIIFIPLSMAFHRYQKSKKIASALPHALTFLFFFSILIFTKSRSGILGFAIGLAIFSILTFYKSSQKKKLLTTLFAFYILLTTIYYAVGKGTISQVDRYLFPVKKTATTSSFLRRQESSPQKPTIQVGTQLANGGTESGDIRKIVWSGAIDVWKANPLFGTGVETFAYSYYNHRPVSHNHVSEWDFLYNKAHNEFLNFLATTGIFGLGSYLLFIGYILVWLAKNTFKSSKNTPTSLYISLISGFIALSISNFFGFSTVGVALLFFLLPAVAFSVSETTTPFEEVSEDEMGGGQNLFVFTLLIFGLYLLYQVSRIYTADLSYAKGKAANGAKQVQLSLTHLEKAIKTLPSEPTYKDEFAKAATNAAIYLYSQNEASPAAQIASLSLEASSQALDQNKVHLNFYKTRAKILANLAQFNPQLYPEVEVIMKKAISLSPTDPKLHLSLGLVYQQLQKVDLATKYMEKSIQLKPDYELARFTIGEYYINLEKPELARTHLEYILTHIPSQNHGKVKTLLEKID